MRRWFVVMGAGVLALANLPLLFGILGAAPGERFLGVTAWPPDGFVHLDWLDQGLRGGLRLENHFNGPREQLEFFHPFFAGTGLLFHPFGVGSVTAIHLVRNLLGAALLAFLAAFFGRRLGDSWLALTAFGIAATGSGLSWALTPGMREWLWKASGGTLVAMDRILPDPTSVFPNLAHRPLSVFAMLLLLGAMECAAAGERKGSAGWFAVAGGLGLLLALTHPFDAVTLLVTMAIWLFVERRSQERFGSPISWWSMALVPVAAGLAVEGMQAKGSGVLGAAFRDVMASTSPVGMLLGFGPALALAVVGFVRTPDRWSARDGHLWAFPLAVALLVYAPYPQARRAVFGLWPFLVLWAFRGWTSLQPWLVARHLGGPRAMTLGLVLAATSVGACASHLTACREWLRSDHRSYFANRDEIAALETLAARPAFSETVFGETRTSLWIPAHAHQFVIYANGLLSHESDSKQELWNALRRGTLAADQGLAALRTLGVTTIWWDDAWGAAPAWIVPGLPVPPGDRVRLLAVPPSDSKGGPGV